MDSTLWRSILNFLISSSDLLRFNLEHARYRSPWSTKGKACIQFHRSLWLGNHYDWRFYSGKEFKSFSTRTIPNIGLRAVALLDRNKTIPHIHTLEAVYKGDIEAGQADIVDIMDMQVFKWEDDRVEVNLTGNKISGYLVLYRENSGKFIMVRR